MQQLTRDQEKTRYLEPFNHAQDNWAGDPSWLQELRAEARTRFDETSFPTTKVEDWKYTNIAPLLRAPWVAPARDAEAALAGDALELACLGETPGRDSCSSTACTTRSIRSSATLLMACR